MGPSQESGILSVRGSRTESLPFNYAVGSLNTVVCGFLTVYYVDLTCALRRQICSDICVLTHENLSRFKGENWTTLKCMKCELNAYVQKHSTGGVNLWCQQRNKLVGNCTRLSTPRHMGLALLFGNIKSLWNPGRAAVEVIWTRNANRCVGKRTETRQERVVCGTRGHRAKTISSFVWRTNFLFINRAFPVSLQVEILKLTIIHFLRSASLMREVILVFSVPFFGVYAYT